MYKGLLVGLVVVLTGCAPTLEYQKAGAQAVQTETAMQAQLAAQVRLERVRRLARVANRLKGPANSYCRSLGTRKTGCSFPVLLSDGQSLNAAADGKRVYIHAGMMRFVESDDELAYIVGHELAHNVLEHIDKKRGNAILGGVVDVLLTAATGVSTDGAFSKAGAGAYSQAFESEADYLGMYIAAQAGYDISSGPLFWRRMAIESSGSIAAGYQSSHPSTPQRFVALTNTIDEIHGKQAMGLALMPRRDGEGENENPVAVAKAQTGPVAESMAFAGTGVARRELVKGPQSYTLGEVAKASGCASADGYAPPVALLEDVGPVELYEAQCYGAPVLRYRCEWQDCRRVED